MSISSIARERNGRRQRGQSTERTADVLAIVRAQPHRRPLGDKFGDWRAESPFGWLALSGEISDKQYQAGLFWRRLVGRAKWAIACPSDRPAQLQLLKTYGLGRDPTPEESNTARREYDDATYYIRTQFAVWNGHRVLKVLKFVVCQDHPCQDLGLLKAGLNVLSNYQSLTNKRK